MHNKKKLKIIQFLYPRKFKMEENNKSDGYEIRTHAHKFQRPGGFHCFNHSANPSI